MYRREVSESNAMRKYQVTPELENAGLPCKGQVSNDVGTSLLPPTRSALRQLQNDVANVYRSTSKNEAAILEQQQPAKPARLKVYSEMCQPVGEQPLTQVVVEPTLPELPIPVVAEPAATVAVVPDVDAKDPANALLMSNYVSSIFLYLRELEVKYPIASGFLSNSRVTPSMRTILVDWLVDVHGRFRLVPETLYITVAILDRYLQVDKTIDSKTLQLVGLTSMLLACKYEEIYAPDMAEFRYVADNAYSLKDLLKMEVRILKALDFSLGRPIPLQFLRRFTKVASNVNGDVNIQHHTLAKYLMELTLTEYSCCHYLPSAVAAAALCLSFMTLDTKNTPTEVLWDATMVHYSGYRVEDIQPLMKHLASLVLKAETSKYQAVRRKYNSEKFYNISTIRELLGSRLLSMAAQHMQIA